MLIYITQCKVMKRMNKQVLRVFKMGIHWYRLQVVPLLLCPLRETQKKKNRRGECPWLPEDEKCMRDPGTRRRLFWISFDRLTERGTAHILLGTSKTNTNITGPLHCFIWGAGLQQWWEHSPTNMAQVWFSIISGFLGSLLCSKGFSLGTPIFPSPKIQHLICNL